MTEKAQAAQEKPKKKHHGESLKHLFAGGVAGAVSRTSVSPLERLKILYQVQPASQIRYKGIWDSLRTILKEEGIMGYFKGNGTNVIRIFPYSAVQFAAYEHFAETFADSTGSLNPLSRLFAGSLAGLTSVTVTYPLDLVRTRLSVQSAEYMKYTGIANAFTLILKEEGFGAFFKGISATLMGVAPYVGLNFMCYETLKSFVKKNLQPDPSTVQLLTCGGIAGAVAQTITYPFDVLRRKMQMQGFNEHHPTYGSTWQCVKYTWKNQSVGGFYKGLLPNYLKVVPSIAITFVVYEKVKKLIGA